MSPLAKRRARQNAERERRKAQHHRRAKRTSPPSASADHQRVQRKGR